MVIEKKPFVPYRLESERKSDNRKVVSVPLNIEELRLLERDAIALNQEKPATLIKEMVEIARIVIHDDKIGAILRIVLDNLRRNERQGIVQVNPKFSQM